MIHKDLYGRFSEPPHPGEILREDILPKLGVTRKELAASLGISQRRLSELLLERRSVNADLAARLNQAIGCGVHFWLGLQFQYDLWWARRLQLENVRQLRPPAPGPSGLSRSGSAVDPGTRPWSTP